jgi:hypothetical protein
VRRVVLACLFLASCAGSTSEDSIPVPPTPPAVSRPATPVPTPAAARKTLRREANEYAGKPDATAAGMAEYRTRLERPTQ